MLNEKIFRKKWCNLQLTAKIIEIYMIFEIFKQRGFPHLRQFVESPFIFVHLIILEILENCSERMVKAARMSPRPSTNVTFYSFIHTLNYFDVPLWLYPPEKKRQNCFPDILVSG